MTKDFASQKFDIIWLRLRLKSKDQIYCFFHAPGANRSDEEVTSFYDDLRKGYQRYQIEDIFMIGDSNARLGSFSSDTDVHGKLTTNKNRPHFMGFLSFSGLKYVNNTFAKGVPTYEIKGSKKSIIDVCLTNALNEVHDFAILPNTLGVNPQTCHRVLELTMSRPVDLQKTKCNQMS